MNALLGPLGKGDVATLLAAATLCLFSPVVWGCLFLQAARSLGAQRRARAFEAACAARNPFRILDAARRRPRARVGKILAAVAASFLDGVGANESARIGREAADRLLPGTHPGWGVLSCVLLTLGLFIPLILGALGHIAASLRALESLEAAGPGALGALLEHAGRGARPSIILSASAAAFLGFPAILAGLLQVTAASGGRERRLALKLVAGFTATPSPQADAAFPGRALVAGAAFAALLFLSALAAAAAPGIPSSFRQAPPGRQAPDGDFEP